MIVETFIFTRIAVSDLGKTLKITLFSQQTGIVCTIANIKNKRESSISFVLYCYGIVGDVRYLVVV